MCNSQLPVLYSALPLTKLVLVIHLVQPATTANPFSHGNTHALIILRVLDLQALVLLMFLTERHDPHAVLPEFSPEMSVGSCGTVSKCWRHVQDVVTRSGKFYCMYKRPGKRVIVNDAGHMMVAPSLMETSIQQNIAGMQLHHALLCDLLPCHSMCFFRVHKERICAAAHTSSYDE